MSLVRISTGDKSSFMINDYGPGSVYRFFEIPYVLYDFKPNLNAHKKKKIQLLPLNCFHLLRLSKYLVSNFLAFSKAQRM